MEMHEGRGKRELKNSEVDRSRYLRGKVAVLMYDDE